MSAVATDTQKTSTPAPVAECNRVASVRFHNAVPFNGTESLSVQVQGGITVQAARLEADGRAVPIGPNQQASGLVFERVYLDRNAQNKPKRERAFVFGANIAGIVYGE